LAIAAGNKGFLAVGDWLKAYQDELQHFRQLRGTSPKLKAMIRERHGENCIA